MGSYSILGVSPQGFNYDVLLDPLEEDLNIPSVPVQAGYLGCADIEVVRDKHDFLFGLLVINANCAYRLRIKYSRLGDKTDGEVPPDTSLPVGL